MILIYSPVKQNIESPFCTKWATTIKESKHSPTCYIAFKRCFSRMTVLMLSQLSWARKCLEALFTSVTAAKSEVVHSFWRCRFVSVIIILVKAGAGTLNNRQSLSMSTIF